MDWSKLAEDRITEAMANGELKPGKGVGQPLEMDEYFKPRDEDRVAAHVLRMSGHVPEEVSLLQEMAQLRTALEKASDEDRRRTLKARLLQVEVEWNMKRERRMMRAPGP